MTDFPDKPYIQITFLNEASSLISLKTSILSNIPAENSMDHRNKTLGNEVLAKYQLVTVGSTDKTTHNKKYNCPKAGIDLNCKLTFV